MKVAAYCRVSTEKEEQLDSLNKQIEYFQDYAKNKGYELVDVYADEGISGKQMKNRVRFIKMLKDAVQGNFELILVKDISRFARNTLDFLEVIRKLKSINVGIQFVNNSQTIEGSEFTLTLFAAMAQEESAKLSERVKWDKNITAKQGRVPNFVFGYDKLGKFTLSINEQESEAVKKMYSLLIEEGYGTARIAEYLNKNRIPTKKNKVANWSQGTVITILRNRIYTGMIINKKSEVSDFLTGARRSIDTENQIIIERPEIRIISDETYEKAMMILEERKDSFKKNGSRESTKHPFSNLIKCSECGYSFRRMHRQYTEGGKEYKTWVCSLRNAKGKDSCCNKTIVGEDALLDYVKEYFESLSKQKELQSKRISREIRKILNEQNKGVSKSLEQCQKEIESLEKKKHKYTEMYANEIITMEELKKNTEAINEDMKSLGTEIYQAKNKDVIIFNIEKAVSDYTNMMENIIEINNYNNEELRQIIDKIVVSADNLVEIFLKIDSDAGLNIPVTLNNDHT